MTTQLNRSTNKALAHLRLNLESGTWKKGQRLPLYRELARDASVGMNAMSQAIALLVKKHVLCSRQKTGTFVGKTIPLKAQITPASKSYKNDTIKKLIKQEILEGFLHNRDFLPSTKELMVYFETSFRTIKSVIAQLYSEGWITPSKKKYRITLFAQTRQNNSILFIAGKSIFASLFWSYERLRAETFIRTIEKECAQKRISLVKHHYSDEINLPNIDSTTFGFIIWYSWEIHHTLIDLVKMLAPFHRPIILVNTLLYSQSPLVTEIINYGSHCPYLFYCSYDHDYRAAFRMGRFLYEKGHKSICFFGLSPDNKESWVQERFRGIDEALQEFGIRTGVHYYAPEATYTAGNLLRGEKWTGPLDKEFDLIEQGLEGIKQKRYGCGYFA